MTIYILDSETTGISKNDQVIELAYLKCNSLQHELTKYNKFDESKIEGIKGSVECTRYLPSCQINPHAHAVHGINRTMLIGKPLSSSLNLPNNIAYIIGHNISFDKRLLIQSNPKLAVQLEQVKYVCTLSLARLLSKHHGIRYENHQLDTLTKHYYPEYPQLITSTHSAKNDVIKNMLVLLKLVEHLPESIDNWDKLFEMQENIKKVR
jgi:exodeoxyribonuclease X